MTDAQDDSQIAKAKKRTDKLNQLLMKKARDNIDIGYLASPMTGGGLAAGRFQLLFLSAYQQGKKQPTECAIHTWNILKLQGHVLLKEGKRLETPDENLAELTDQANTFFQKQLPIMKALQIA